MKSPINISQSGLSWQAQAFNQVPDSKNEIHGDQVARDYGFKGGLVPGVTVSAYLLHPIAAAIAEPFIETGAAHCRITSPLYDDERFTVEVEQPSNGHFLTRLTNPQGVVTANAEVTLPENPLTPPVRRGDPLAEDSHQPPLATPENMQKLQKQGCFSFSYTWEPGHAMWRYLRDDEQMADCFFRQQKANPSFILGVSNWVLASNAVMNPWVHMETTSQNYASISRGTVVIGEMCIDDLFEKKGHCFVDATVNLFDATDSRCYSSVKLRAIYRLRGL